MYIYSFFLHIPNFTDLVNQFSKEIENWFDIWVQYTNKRLLNFTTGVPNFKAVLPEEKILKHQTKSFRMHLNQYLNHNCRTLMYNVQYIY